MLTKRKIVGVGLVGILMLFVGSSIISSTNGDIQPVSDIQMTRKVTKKTLVKESDIEFTTTERDDATLPQGERAVSQAGILGKKSQTYEVTYSDSIEIDRKLVYVY